MKINVKQREIERETKHIFTTVSFQVSLMFSFFNQNHYNFLKFYWCINYFIFH